MEEPDLEESSANVRKNAVDVILQIKETDREMCESTALRLRGRKSLAINLDANCNYTRWC